ncbi:MAG TPA: cupin domain-containing protein [Gemmatimonadales bacterium]|nr:cupin domain-containing protein [Gemmatimonadales bacterium]
MRSRFAIAALAALLVPSLAGAQSSTPVWGAAPPLLPAGARLAVLQGDPSKPAFFTLRLEFPDGYRLAPHWHPTDESITVISGTFLIGMGDTLDAAKVSPLPTGGFVFAGANQHHYAIARGRTVVQINGMGPFTLTYVNAKDDPRNKLSSR